MSEQLVQPAPTPEMAAPLDRPNPEQLLAIAAVVVLTMLGVAAVFRLFGPDVRPASTPAGWSGVYGDRFALALPNDFGTTTEAADLQEAAVPGAQLIAAKEGLDPNTPDAIVMVVASEGTAEALVSTMLGNRNATSSTTITSGDAITSDVSIKGASGRIWIMDRDEGAWAVWVVVRDGGPYGLDDLGTKIANSFDAG